MPRSRSRPTATRASSCGSTAMLAVGGQRGPLRTRETVDLAQGPTEEALSIMGSVARDAPAPGFETSNEATARLSVRDRATSAFQLNYTFAPASAGENAPDVVKNLGHRALPGGERGQAAAAAARRLQPRRLELLREPRPRLRGRRLHRRPGEPDHRGRARRAAAVGRERCTRTEGVEKASRASPTLVKESIDNAAPRPLTPAYTDLSLAIQRALHPPGEDRPGRSDARLRGPAREGRAGGQAGGPALMEAASVPTPAPAPKKRGATDERTRGAQARLDALRAGGGGDAARHRLSDRLRARPLAAGARPALPRRGRLRRARQLRRPC